MKTLEIIIIFILSFSVAKAQWQPTNGFFQESVWCFTQSGDNIFAGTGGNGVLISKDKGLSWEYLNSGLPIHTTIRALAGTSTYVFVGTDYEGVYRSSNNGSSWKAANKGLTNLQISDLIYTGINILAGTDDGLFLSNNNGNSWIKVTSGLPYDFTIGSFTLNGTNVIMSTSGGLFLSSDNGNSWSAINTGIPENYNYKMELAGNNSKIVAVSGHNVYLTNNNGLSWKAINKGLPANAFFFTVTLCDTNIIIASQSNGVFLSANNGASWKAVNGLAGGLSYPYSFFTSDKVVFAGLFDGIYVSTNYGNDWEKQSNGLNQNVFNITSLASNAAITYAGTDRKGIHISTDNGSNWGYTNRLFEEASVSFAFIGNTVFTSTNGGVYKSLNNGVTWEYADYGLPHIYGDGIPSIISNGTNLYAATETRGVYISTNNGLNWAVINNGLTNLNVRSLVCNGTNIFAGTDGGGIFMSADNGSSWKPVNNGLKYKDIRTLAINGSDLYAVTYFNGIFLSTDNGNSWILANNGLTNLNISSVVGYGKLIFAGTTDGVFLSTNKGSNWIKSNLGLPDETNIISLAISGTSILAGTMGKGVWKRSLFEFTDIEEADNEENISIYPNPANDKIIIDLHSFKDLQDIKISIFNISGQEIIQQSISDNITELNISNLEKGIYLVKIIGGEKFFLSKIIKI